MSLKPRGEFGFCEIRDPSLSQLRELKRKVILAALFGSVVVESRGRGSVI